MPDTRVLLLLLVLLAALEGSMYYYVHVNLRHRHRRRFFSAASRSTNPPTVSAYARTRVNEKSVGERIKKVKKHRYMRVPAGDIVLLRHSTQSLPITFLPHQLPKSTHSRWTQCFTPATGTPIVWL